MKGVIRTGVLQPVSLKSVREKKSLSSNIKLFQLLLFTRGIKAVGRLLPQLRVTAGERSVSGLAFLPLQMPVSF